MPKKEALDHWRATARAAELETKRDGPKIGAAEAEDDTKPPTFHGATVLSAKWCNFCVRDLLDGDAAVRYLQRAAYELRERHRLDRSVVDVEEMMLYWMEIWGDWRLSSSPDDLPPFLRPGHERRKRVRTDRKAWRSERVLAASYQQDGGSRKEREACRCAGNCGWHGG